MKKLHPSIKLNGRLLSKSIEEQANDAVAHLFAVYIEQYRCTDVPKQELSYVNQQLLTLIQYAKEIQFVFGRT